MPKTEGKPHAPGVSGGPRATGTGLRLIETWFPMAALSEECARERRSMTALPANYYLHVWWARRPLVASRAAALGAILPASADQRKFMHALGIHGAPVAAKLRIDEANRGAGTDKEKKAKLGPNPYGYERAFNYLPNLEETKWAKGEVGGTPCILDPTSGGGSIPFEALRLSYNVHANDLNPVAWLVCRATVEFPRKFGAALHARFLDLTRKFLSLAEPHFREVMPAEKEGTSVDAYLWARTIECPYCGGVVPLSPNWRLDASGTGVRLVPEIKPARRVRFEIVTSLKLHSKGTVGGGDAECPFPDCGRVIDGDAHMKSQAQAGKMGEQLYAISFSKRQVVGKTKAGKNKVKRVAGFRAPGPGDEISERITALLEARMPEWQARGIVPDEEVLQGEKTKEPLTYGMRRWRDMFSPRQLYGHCVGVDTFQSLLQQAGGAADLSDLDRAAFTYLAISLDKLLNYNSRMSVWMSTRQVIANTFNRHDFAFCWSHAEMPPAVTGHGFEWIISQTGKSLKELIELVQGTPLAVDQSHIPMFKKSAASSASGTIDVSCVSADSLTHVATNSVDAVVMDPPYYNNVMYAELSDFFYVWLKRTAGLLFPESFQSYLTDKDREAVANPSKFKDFTSVRGSGGAEKRAKRDYQERMQAIFVEMRRVLKSEGVMVLMFTHKATGAWDALAKGLVDAGFEITASWPVNTEAEDSLHIKDKNAAKSTIMLVCRPRKAEDSGGDPTYWEDVEPKVTEVVRQKVQEFQANGVGGVDLYLACFGPALQVFSEHWPMKRGRALQKPPPVKGKQYQLFEEEDWDPYAVRPEDALMAARRAVKEWRLDQLATVKRQANLDAVTEFFVLAWDAFRAPKFPADEAIKLARVVGVNFDAQLRGRTLELDGANVVLLDSLQRAKKGVLGSISGDCVLDALHHVARIAREQNTEAAREALELAQLDHDDRFQRALQAVLSVLPTPRMVTGKDSPLTGAAADADALERVRQLLFAKEIPVAKQWEFFDKKKP